MIPGGPLGDVLAVAFALLMAVNLWLLWRNRG